MGLANIFIDINIFIYFWNIKYMHDYLTCTLGARNNILL